MIEAPFRNKIEKTKVNVSPIFSNDGEYHIHI